MLKKFLPIGLLTLIIFSSSCQKGDYTDKYMEPFTFSGRVYNCATGKSLAGIQVDLEAQRLGMFVNHREIVAGTYTDENGYYSFRPRQANFNIEEYELTIHYPDGHSLINEYIGYDTLKKDIST